MDGLFKKQRDILQKLVHIWEDYGLDNETVVHKMEETMKEMENCCNHILLREQKKAEEMISRLNGLMHEATKLSKELDLEFIPEEYDHLPLCETVKQLEKDVNKLNTKKSLEMENFLQIVKKEEELCSCLGVPPVIKRQDELPPKEAINAYKEILTRLQAKKGSLFNIYQEKKRRIAPILEQLEYCPSNSFERDVLIEDDDKFRLTEENMMQLDEFESTLLKKLQEREDYVNSLVDKISKLWTRTKESPTYQADFCARNSGLSSSTVKALQEELKRCHQMRMENIPHYLKIVREEIEELWEKCCIGRKQRSNFLEFYSDSCSETLLNILEQEAFRLSEFYKENRGLIDLIVHHEQLWERFMDLEKKSQDKDRLFRNRGGELLREEKERNSLRKELPKVETQIKNLVKKYQEKKNEPFYYFDEDLVKKMEEQWRIFKGSRLQKSSQKEHVSAEQCGSKRKLEPHSSSQKSKQFKPTPKEHNIPPVAQFTQNVKRRLVAPSTVLEDTYSLGVKEIEPSYINFKDNIKYKSSLKREAFKDLNSRAVGSSAQAPVKPPRKNLISKITLRRLSSDLVPTTDTRPLKRRSSLPNFEML